MRLAFFVVKSSNSGRTLGCLISKNYIEAIQSDLRCYYLMMLTAMITAVLPYLKAIVGENRRMMCDNCSF